MSSPDSLDEELGALHAWYVDAVNSAVAAGEMRRVEELSARYDEDTVELLVRYGARAPEPHATPSPVAWSELRDVVTLGATPPLGAVRRLAARLRGHTAA